MLLLIKCLKEYRERGRERERMTIVRREINRYQKKTKKNTYLKPERDSLPEKLLMGQKSKVNFDFKPKNAYPESYLWT